MRRITQIGGVLSGVGGLLLSIYLDAAKEFLDSLISQVFGIPKLAVGYYVVVGVIVAAGLYFFAVIAYLVYQRVKKRNKLPVVIGEANRSLTVDLKSNTETSKIHLVCFSISNHPDVLGETAKNVEVSLAPFPYPFDRRDLVSVTLPWLTAEVNPPLRIEGHVDFKKPYDVVQSMRSQYLKYEKTDIEQGIGKFVVAFFGLESTGKVYLASKDPVELGEPIERLMPSLRFLLGVSGDNFRLVHSDDYFAFGAAWDKIGVVPMRDARLVGRAPLMMKVRRYLKYGHV